MIYIYSEPYPNMTAFLTPQMIGDAAEDVLIVSVPLIPHADFTALLDTDEITDVQERMIQHYRPRICYQIEDADGRTYAKLRLQSHSTSENPAYLKAQTAAANAESDELLNLLGENVERQYLKRIEELNHA